MFEPCTASRTIGRYRLLILDGHGSHATAEFDRFCMKKKIILLYMSSHFSHLLQSLDVFYFSSLKHLYDQRVQKKIQKRIHSIQKEDFLYIYPAIHQQILSGFVATGLIHSFSPERVLFNIQKAQTSSSTSHSNQSFSTDKTSANIYQLKQQKRIESFKGVNSVLICDG